jgi:small conductance mechanosensitive channel
MAQKAKNTVGEALVRMLGIPFIVLIIMAGLFLAVRFLPWKEDIGSYVYSGTALALGLLGLYFVLGLINSVLRWYEKQMASKRQLGLTMHIVNIFRIAVIVIGVLLGIVIGLSIFGIQSVPITSWLSEHGLRFGLIIALCLIVIVMMGQFIPKVVTNLMARRTGELEEEVQKRSETLSRVLINVAQVFVLTITLFMVLSELKIDIAPMLAGLGVVGVAIGFGAQSLVKDILGGLFVIFENQYRVGDIVRIGGVAGLVQDISLRRTILRDLDGEVHFVPNGEIRVTSNLTKELSRVNINVTVALNNDLERVISVINRVGHEMAEDRKWAPLILKAPQVLRVNDIGSKGCVIKITGDTKPMQQWDVTGELRKRLKTVFESDGITMA